MNISSFDYTNLSLTGIIIFMAAFFIGIKFPDWDFKMKLRHRNILTHSPIVVGVFCWIYQKNPSQEFRYFIIGFSLAIGIHLIFDIFPKGWGGGALLQTPFIRYSFQKNISKILFFTFIVLSLGISIVNTLHIEEVFFIFAYGTLAIFLNTVKEEKLLRPMGMYVLIMVAAASFEYVEVRESVLIVYTNVQKTLINLL